MNPYTTEIHQSNCIVRTTHTHRNNVPNNNRVWNVIQSNKVHKRSSCNSYHAADYVLFVFMHRNSGSSSGTDRAANFSYILTRWSDFLPLNHTQIHTSKFYFRRNFMDACANECEKWLDQTCCVISTHFTWNYAMLSSFASDTNSKLQKLHIFMYTRWWKLHDEIKMVTGPTFAPKQPNQISKCISRRWLQFHDYLTSTNHTILLSLIKEDQNAIPRSGYCLTFAIWYFEKLTKLPSNFDFYASL